jgi:hypothetical protein
MSNAKGFVTRSLMLALGLFLLLPAATASAQDGSWRRNRDRREERRDRRSDTRNNQRDARDVDGDGDYDQRDATIIQQRQRNGGYGNNGSYGNRGNGSRGYGNYGYGNYSNTQQTALNAGYNEGIKEGRRNRGRGYRNLNDIGAYRSADKDYNSRYGNRYEYQQYFRRGFENGFNDGLNGY